MKTRYLLLAFGFTLFSFFWTATGVAQENSTLRVHVEGCRQPTNAVVLVVSNGQLYPVDTLGTDTNSNFQFVLAEKKPAFFLVRLTSPSLRKEMQPMHMLLLPGEEVSMDVHVDTLTSNLHIMHVAGSKNMEEYRQFNNLLTDAMSSPSLQSQLPQRVEQLLVANRSNLMSAFLVTFFENDFANYAALYKYIGDELVKTYPDNDFVLHLLDKTKGMLLAGVPAPDIEMPDRDGKLRKLSSLKGKVVLLDFWASWCRPCRGENPNVVRLYHQYHDKGFEIFSVSLDKNRNDWLAAIKQDGLVWENHVSDLKGWTSSGGKTYGISSIPATVLIGPDGIIIARNLRGRELENALKEIFENE